LSIFALIGNGYLGWPWRASYDKISRQGNAAMLLF